MLAFHSLWTAPVRAAGRVPTIPDYELVTMILSALQWRRWNGKIRMMTDSEGMRLLEDAGLCELWNEGPEPILDAIPREIDPRLFWAAGKLAALRAMRFPCVMLDTDLIVWEPLKDRINGSSALAAHWEPLNPAVYPPPEKFFRLAPGYSFPNDWDFTMPAANTAFLYLADSGFAEKYTDAAFSFMRALQNRNADPTVAMCFAEQRILPMCAAASGIPLRCLLDVQALEQQSLITHLWGHKRVLAASREQREAYCLLCLRRILTEFPAWADVLAENRQLAPYLQKISSELDG